MAAPNSSRRVTVATDDGRTIEISINTETRQVFLAVTSSQRPAQHIATFNAKNRGLEDLIDTLIDGAGAIGHGWSS